MRHYILKLSFLVLTVCSISAYAEVLSKEAIPEKIMQHINKKHPKAIDISAETTKHFGQDVTEVHLKENGVSAIEIYRSNGNYHVSGINIAADDLMFATSRENLKKVFPEYAIKEAFLIVNPNGVGEEFDVILEAAGKQWDVSIDKAGNVEKKELN
ncbi:hypothetical protein [Crenothrix polyspora]|jgi:hypothetical protein|uniref:PepSY domain-containing protein n=1 Tax=Crenothrix polyspora TaxID=360316 RepID=A0A1R4H6U4_9GAMM|nr:hypothetical protein [Crenothrix polyspora]SJM91570.1 conserved exported hypothetical protein [Crenothrix polyspora]